MVWMHFRVEFSKIDQFVGFSEKFSSFSCHTFADVKLM